MQGTSSAYGMHAVQCSHSAWDQVCQRCCLMLSYGNCRHRQSGGSRHCSGPAHRALAKDRLSSSNTVMTSEAVSVDVTFPASAAFEWAGATTPGIQIGSYAGLHRVAAKLTVKHLRRCPTCITRAGSTCNGPGLRVQQQAQHSQVAPTHRTCLPLVVAVLPRCACAGLFVTIPAGPCAS